MCRDVERIIQDDASKDNTLDVLQVHFISSFYFNYL
ncbi:hypothetical protein [Desulfovibrio desulfuricans]